MRIGIVEDNRITRETLEAILRAEPMVTEVTSYETAEDAIAHIFANPPHILLVDLDLPGMHGTDLIHHIKQQALTSEILVYTVFEDRETVFAALKAGAAGYILKGSSPQELIASLTNLLQGGAPMSPRIARKVLLELQQTPLHEPNPLSCKEAQVLQQLEQGLSYKEIAEELKISPHTVHSHIKSIYEKLQAKDKKDALFLAKKKGFL
jgi:DNA-binding NarL/FixJ family response regulator